MAHATAKNKRAPKLSPQTRNLTPLHPTPNPNQTAGGDNSNSAMGCFYEGVMVSGVTTDSTDEAVQANIVAVGYANWAPPS